MDTKCQIIVFLFSITTVVAFNGKLDERFNHYETLHHSAIRHEMVKRSAPTAGNEMVFSVDTLGRHFKLRLQSARGLFSRDFQAYREDSQGKTRKIHVDTRDFYEGYVDGEPESQVHAYWEGHDLVATIDTTEDVYVIEPSWRHLPADESYSMISYRKSDMVRRTENDMRNSHCGYVHPDGSDDAAPENFTPIRTNNVKPKEFQRRYKRQSSSQTYCRVHLVADYHFFQEIGSSSEATTVNYMASVISEVNKVFKSTTFGSQAGYGLQIISVNVHEEPTTSLGDNGLHYNMQRTGNQWDINDLLKEFSKGDRGDVCLAHLFTSQAFNDGVLGLGWIASNTAGTTGGICSQISGGLTYNTAWSSSKNSGGDRLTTLEANLVTSHEFGHNWGSPHDPTDCTPSALSGGKYLMYQYSVKGYDENNSKFSSCSRSTIAGVLDAKSSCFVDPDDAYCGNGIVEGSEQCDGGPDTLAGNDPCCATGCRFKAKYKCSDVNHACCDNCLLVPASENKQCSFTGSITASCYENAFCNGVSKDCPTPEHKANGTDCGDEGSCLSGECLSFCEERGKLDCECEDLQFSCKRCCRDSSSDTCTPVIENDVYSDHKDGKPCVIGICASGVCDQQIVSANDRTWEVINFLTENGLAEFFRSNIVLTVVVISLLIYIPIVIIVLIIDWRNDKEDDELTKDWYNKESEKLIRDDDDRVIRPTYTKRRALNYRNKQSDQASDVASTRASTSGVHLGPL